MNKMKKLTTKKLKKNSFKKSIRPDNRCSKRKGKEMNEHGRKCVTNKLNH